MRQGLLPLGPQPISEDRLLPANEIAACRTFEQALRLSMRNSLVPTSQDTWAEAFDNTPGTFSRIVNNDLLKTAFERDEAKQTSGKKGKFLPRYFDNNRIKQAIQLFGNAAILQYLCHGTPWKVVRKTREEMLDERSEQEKAERIKELENELAELKGQRAA